MVTIPEAGTVSVLPTNVALVLPPSMILHAIVWFVAFAGDNVGANTDTWPTINDVGILLIVDTGTNLTTVKVHTSCTPSMVAVINTDPALVVVRRPDVLTFAIELSLVPHTIVLFELVEGVIVPINWIIVDSKRVVGLGEITTALALILIVTFATFERVGVAPPVARTSQKK